VQCIVNGEENPLNCPFLSGFCHPAGDGPSHGGWQRAQNIGKGRACGSGDDRGQIHTDVLITILCQRSHGQTGGVITVSREKTSWLCYLGDHIDMYQYLLLTNSS